MPACMSVRDIDWLMPCNLIHHVMPPADGAEAEALLLKSKARWPPVGRAFNILTGTIMVSSKNEEDEELKHRGKRQILALFLDVELKMYNSVL